MPVLMAGCGSSSDKDSSSDKKAEPARLTQQQFVSAANAVCIKSDRRVFRLGNLSRLPAGWAATASAARTGVAEMSVLRGPVGSDAGFQHMLTLGKQLAAGIQQVHDALAKKNYKAAEAAQLKATNTDTAIHLQARTLGLTFCQQLLTNWPA
jgi:hypothetical protein